MHNGATDSSGQGTRIRMVAAAMCILLLCVAAALVSYSVNHLVVSSVVTVRASFECRVSRAGIRMGDPSRSGLGAQMRQFGSAGQPSSSPAPASSVDGSALGSTHFRLKRQGVKDSTTEH